MRIRQHGVGVVVHETDARARRDLFAAAALQGMLAAEYDAGDPPPQEEYVDAAWKLAELMIAREPK